MKKNFKAALFCILLCLLGGQSQACEDATLFAQRIAMAIEEIQSSPDGSDRARQSSKLVEILARSSGEERVHIDVAAVDSIAAFLDDENDAVRQDAARSLGLIGAPAASALPALEAALAAESADSSPGEIYGPGTFRAALLSAIARIRRSRTGGQ